MFIMYLQGKTYINKTSSSLRLVCCQQCWCWLSDWTYLQQCIFRRLWYNWSGEIIIQVTLTLVLQRVCECECEWGFLVNNQSCASVNRICLFPNRIGDTFTGTGNLYVRSESPQAPFDSNQMVYVFMFVKGDFYLWLVDVGDSRLPQPAICGTLLVEP